MTTGPLGTGGSPLRNKVLNATWAECFGNFVKKVPPAYALWRSAEATALANVEFEQPVLDLGCGDGMFAKLSFLAPLAVGIDRSKQQARRAVSRGSYQDVVVADATNLPFAAGSFATVLSNCVLEHVPDLVPVFDEVQRVLLPGGIFAFTVTSGHFDEYLFGAEWLQAHGMAGLSSRLAATINDVFAHRHNDGAGVWYQRLASAGLSPVRCREIVPHCAEALWTILLAITAPMVATQSVNSDFASKLCRLTAPVWRALIAPRLTEGESSGGGLVVVARKN